MCNSLAKYLKQRPNVLIEYDPLPFQSTSIYLWLSSSLLGLGRFSVSEFYTQSVGLLGREISPSQGLYLYTEQHKQNKRTQTSMPRMGFERTIPVFERRRLFMP
jgi:hypothetical protein